MRNRDYGFITIQEGKDVFFCSKEGALKLFQPLTEITKVYESIFEQELKDFDIDKVLVNW